MKTECTPPAKKEINSKIFRKGHRTKSFIRQTISQLDTKIQFIHENFNDFYNYFYSLLKFVFKNECSYAFTK